MCRVHTEHLIGIVSSRPDTLDADCMMALRTKALSRVQQH